MAAKTLEQLEAEVRKQREIIKQQATALKVAEATAPKKAKPVVVIDGEHYVVLSGERTSRGITTREELAKNPGRLKELKNAGSGILEKVNIK